MTKPGKMPASRQRAARMHHRCEREAIGLARRSAAGLRARPPERRCRTPRTKQAAASAAGKGQQRRRPPAPGSSAPVRQAAGSAGSLGAVSHSEAKPLSGGSAEIADAADKERKPGLRHAVDQAAKPLHVALAGRGQHRAGAEEQQALEDRVVEHVKQRRRSAPARRRRRSHWP